MSYYHWLGREAESRHPVRELFRHAAYFDGEVMRDYFTREPIAIPGYDHLAEYAIAHLENNQD